MNRIFPTLALFAALATLVGCGPSNPRSETIADLSGDAASGATLFTNNCASCHGSDGTGGSGPNIVGEVGTRSDAQLADVILNGEDAMPAFKDTLTDQEIADILAHMRTW